MKGKTKGLTLFYGIVVMILLFIGIVFFYTLNVNAKKESVNEPVIAHDFKDQGNNDNNSTSDSSSSSSSNSSDIVSPSGDYDRSNSSGGVNGSNSDENISGIFEDLWSNK